MHICTYIKIYRYICICTYIHIYISWHVCMHILIYIYIYLCINVYAHTYAYIYIYLYTYTHTPTPLPPPPLSTHTHKRTHQRSKTHPRGTARLHLNNTRHEHDLKEAPVETFHANRRGLFIAWQGREWRIHQREPPHLECMCVCCRCAKRHQVRHFTPTAEGCCVRDRGESGSDTSASPLPPRICVWV